MANPLTGSSVTLANPFNGAGVTLVGSITTAAGLALLRDKRISSDAVEVRADALLQVGVSEVSLLEAVSHSRHPLLLTLRIPEEGGRFAWKEGQRVELYTRLLPYVQAIDVELASLAELAPVIKQAQATGKWVVCSAHALQTPASSDQINLWQNQFCSRFPNPASEQAILKIASVLANQDDLRRLTRILVDHEWPVAVMGLGSMGALSRQIFARLGSRLVYGYLDEAAANGQPSTVQIRQFLPEIFEVY